MTSSPLDHGQAPGARPGPRPAGEGAPKPSSTRGAPGDPAATNGAAATPGDDRPASRRAHRAWRGGEIAGFVVAALVLGVLFCEAAGWPFLVGPMERLLSRTLHRDVQLSRPSDLPAPPGAPSSTRLHLLGAVSAQAPALRIGAPSWSRAPFFLHADHASVRIGYRALWRAHQGEPLDFERIAAERLIVHAERRGDGVASWRFGDPKPPSDTQRDAPQVGELLVRHGELSYQDVPLKADLVAQLQLHEGGGSDNVPAGLHAEARGHWRGNPVSATLQTTGVTPLLASGAAMPPLPMKLDLRLGDARILFDGRVTDVATLRDLDGTVAVRGPSLNAVGAPFGVTLPTTGPFTLDGRVRKGDRVWNLATDAVRIGDSRLNAVVTFDASGAVPRLQGRIGGPRLALADLLPSVGAEARRNGAATPRPRGAKLLPQREFDLPSLKAMDADVQLAFDEATLGHFFAEPLKPLRAHLTLASGKLAVADLEARAASGSIAGRLELDGAGDAARWRSELRVANVRLERWLNQGQRRVPYVTGRLDGRAQLTGSGRSTSQLLATLDGQVQATLRDGTVSHLIVEAAGLDAAQALGVAVRGDNPLALHCAVADLQAKDGVLTPRAFVADTKDSSLFVDGQVSLKTEALDLKLTVEPKDVSPLALRSPVHVRGSLGAPQISVEKGPIARKLGASLLLGLINPIAAVIPLIDPGEGGDKNPGCAALVARVKQQGGHPPGKGS